MPDMLVIGCGVNIHAVHRAGWTEVTVDIDGANAPTHTGDITDPTFVRALAGIYAGHFDLIFFENIPAGVFAEEKTCLVIMNALDQMLAANGHIQLRTGAAGEKVVASIKKTFARWRYQRVYEAARDADIIQRYDLAAQAEDAFNLVFRKIAGARRTAAEV